MFDGFTPRPQLTGYTGIPNEFFRAEVISDLKEAELKILLTTFRKTYGWVDRIENGEVVYKLEDDISYSQYREMTGLSDASIAAALKKLIQKGYLTRLRVGNQSGLTSRYKIRVKGESPDDWVEEQMDAVESTEPEDNSLEDVKLMDSLTPDQIFGRRKSEPEPPKGRKGNYIARFTSRWKDCFRRKGWNLPTLTGRDQKHVKDLVASYGEDEVLTVAEFFVINFPEIAKNLGITSDRPSLPVLWGFRNSIFPMAKTGVIGFQRPANRNKGREFDEDKFKGKGGDFWQT
jgi:hypothetical protein